MQGRIQHFLLVFNHRTGELEEWRPFGEDGDAAVVEYVEVERLHKDEPWYDVVLVGSDSLVTAKVTHANYFDGTAAVSRYLIGL